MTRDEQLNFCKICTKRSFDLDRGIVCGLTNQPADFQDSCETFSEDVKLKEELLSQLQDIGTWDNKASKGSRFANHVLDGIFFLVFSFLGGFVLAIVLLIVSPEALVIFEEDNKLIDYALGFVFGMIYFISFEALTGRTLAKYITGTKVVNENGEKPDFGTICIRSLCRFIPFNAITFLGSENSGLHDRLSKTMVVKV